VGGAPLAVILSAAKNQREAMPSARGHQGQYFVYVMSNRTHVLYVGMTNDLMRRVFEHKRKLLRRIHSALLA